MNFVIESTVTRGTATIQTGKFTGLEQFVVEQIRPATALEDRPFRPASVTGSTGLLWTFKRDHPDFRGSAEFVKHDGEVFIALVERVKYLALLLPIVDLPHLRRTNAGEWIGGRKLQAIISLKETIAEQMGLEPKWTRLEEQLRNAVAKETLEAEAAERRKAREEEEAARAEARRQKEVKLAQILNRPVVSGYTSTGDRRHGIPVGEGEWEGLPNGKFCIMVDEAGKPIEAFIVEKKNSKIRRVNVVSVTAENPLPKQNSTTDVLDVETVVTKFQGEYQPIVIARDMNHVRELNNRNKLNSKTLVAYPKPGDVHRYVVTELADGKIRDVGEVVRKSA